MAGKLKIGLGALAAGAGWAYFFDPNDGTRRRHVLRDRALAMIRQPARKAAATAERKARYAEGAIHGAVHEATTSGDERDASRLNDPALARKVESEVLGGPEAAKGETNVNVENGVVYLRGELDSRSEIERIIHATKGVDGVGEVRSLLHLPGEKPPAKESVRSIT